VLAREKPDGGLSTLWQERAAAAGLEQVDIAPALARLMAVKDAAEITNIKRAAHLSAAVLEKFVVAKMEAVVDDAGKVRICGSHTLQLHSSGPACCRSNTRPSPTRPWTPQPTPQRSPLQ